MKIDPKKYMKTYCIPFIIAIPTSPAIDWLEKYFWNDWEFLRWLVVLIILDTITAIWYHFKKRDLSSNGFSRLPIKLIVYSVLLIVANVLCGFTIQGESQTTFTLFRTVVCNALMIREAFSICENLTKMYPQFVSPKIRKYLDKFNSENGDPE